MTISIITAPFVFIIAVMVVEGFNAMRNGVKQFTAMSSGFNFEVC